MRWMTLLCACLCGLVLTTTARAETYSILEGSISSPEIGEEVPVTGGFDASPVESAGPDQPIVYTLEGFGFEAGSQRLLPRQPIEYDGLRPIFYLEVADQIHLLNHVVTWLRIRTGGELVAESDDEVTFRFLELRSGASNGGQVVGELPESGLPRRFDLHGSVVEVDQSFRIVGPDCLPSFPIARRPAPAPPGGRIIEIGGRGDIALEMSSLQATPAISAAADPLPAPTLEELGVSAPEGAVVTFDTDGVLSITSDGDLFIEGPFPEVSGLTGVYIITPGRVIVSGSLDLPPDVSLEIDAGGDTELPDVIEPPPIIGPFCNGLQPLFPTSDREVGRFSIHASAARPVEIDVRPWQRENQVRLGPRRMLPVALLGSEDLDVRDVDEDSLRLGPAGAEPVAYGSWLLVFRRDVNRDRHRDLVALFDVRRTGIAFGDTYLCLLAETGDGTVLEGCDAIETLEGSTRQGR